jgi:ABC-type multidrug transport system permease subunit
LRAAARDIQLANAARVQSVSGLKFLSDALAIVEVKIIVTKGHWMWHVLGTMIFPFSMLYWATAITPGSFESDFRILVGTVIFGISQTIVSNVGLWTIQDRFTRRMRLLITMPMSKGSYALGTLIYGALQSTITVSLILLFGWVAGADISLHWDLPFLILSVMLLMTGLILVVVSHAPSVNAGIIATSLLSIVLVTLSPVFYTHEQAPVLFRWLGWISPFRYAADGIERSLNG